MPSAGAMNRRVAIQQRNAGQDAIGGQLETWVTIATVWAAIEPLTGRELLAAQSVQSEVTHQLVIRWQAIFANPKAIAAMRVVYGSRIFNITGALNQGERNRELLLLASEGLNQG